MKPHTFFLLLLFSSIFFSCKKEEHNSLPPEVIKPKSYYPVYPGSYWKYRTINKRYYTNLSTGEFELSSIDTNYITEATSPVYILDRYKTGTEKNQYSDYAYVPYFDNKPIYGYLTPVSYNYQGNYHSQLEPFLSEQVGFSNIRGNTERYSVQFTIIDKFKNAENDSVLAVSVETYGADIPSYMESWETYEYYFKDIGLKYTYTYEPINDDTIYKKELIEYHINNQ